MVNAAKSTHWPRITKGKYKFMLMMGVTLLLGRQVRRKGGRKQRGIVEEGEEGSRFRE